MTKKRGKRGPDPTPLTQTEDEIEDMLKRYLDGDTYEQIGRVHNIPSYKVKVVLDRGYFDLIDVENRRYARAKVNKTHWENVMERRRARLGRLGSQ